MPTREFTREELSRYNGQGGSPVYIAYQGQVYDVSQSFLWRTGKHQVLHTAGQDLTSSLKEAPHSDEMLEKFPIVGKLLDTPADTGIVQP